MKILTAALVAVSLILPIAAVAQTPLPAPVTNNTVTTSGPVSSETTISAGTVGGEVLKWVAAVVTTVMGTFGSVLIMRLSKSAGLEISKGLSDQLNTTLLNGLNQAAQNAATQLAGKDPITVKNVIVQQAVRYAQDHRADTIKALGLDPQSGSAVEALKGRIATLVADPTQPTPTVLDAPPLPAAHGA